MLGPAVFLHINNKPMKQKLTTIGISFVTTLLTLATALWCLYRYPIPLSKEVQRDGTVQRARLYLFRGLYEAEVTDKDGRLVKVIQIHHFDPEQTSRVVFYRGVGVSREEVTTVPSDGVNVVKVYKPNSEIPVGSAIVTYPPNSEPQKKFFDGAGTAISREDYKALLAGS